MNHQRLKSFAQVSLSQLEVGKGADAPPEESTAARPATGAANTQSAPTPHSDSPPNLYI